MIWIYTERILYKISIGEKNLGYLLKYVFFKKPLEGIYH